MIQYRKASKKDMRYVASVYQKIFGDYFLIQLGIGLLEKYYSEFFNEHCPFILVVDSEKDIDNEIIGFCMGYLKGSEARSNFERKYKWELLTKLMFLCCLIFNKIAIRKVFARLLAIVKQKDVSCQSKFDFDVGLLSIGLLGDYRGSKNGIGKSLILKFENEVSTLMLGYKHKIFCKLSVKSENIRAKRFYAKMGYRFLREDANEATYGKYLCN